MRVLIAVLGLLALASPAWAVEGRTKNLRWYVPGSIPDQRAGLVADVRVGGEWRDLTSRGYGDWTYPGGSVVTDPTDVSVRRRGRWTVVKLTYGNHRITPVYEQGAEVAYPFRKTVWIRDGERGYYAEVRPLATVGFRAEHEIGFGGLWGPATVTTPEGAYRTGSIDGHYKTRGRVPWATFSRDGDIDRQMILLTPHHVLSPNFTWGSGGAYHYTRTAGTYSAYLYGGGRPVGWVCRHVVRTEPSRLPAPSC